MGTLGSFGSCFEVLLRQSGVESVTNFSLLRGKKNPSLYSNQRSIHYDFFLTLACRIIPSNPFRSFPLSLGYFIAHICWSLISSIVEKNPLQRSRIFSLCSSLCSDTLPVKSSHVCFLPPRLPSLSSQLRENVLSVTPPVCVLIGKFFWALSWNCRAHLLCLPSLKDHFSSLCHAWYLENQFLYVVLVSWLFLCGVVIYFDGKSISWAKSDSGLSYWFLWQCNSLKSWLAQHLRNGGGFSSTSSVPCASNHTLNLTEA